MAFVPRYLHGVNGVVVFRPTTRSRPRLGLVVRCGDLALSQKNMPFVRFFHVQPKYQNNAIFVNIEGFRPCLSKPSYGASQWALVVRLIQKERPKIAPEIAVLENQTIFCHFDHLGRKKTGHFVHFGHPFRGRMGLPKKVPTGAWLRCQRPSYTQRSSHTSARAQ